MARPRGILRQCVVVAYDVTWQRCPVEQIAVVALDLATRVFQVNGAGASGDPVLFQKFCRADVVTLYTIAIVPCRHGNLCVGAWAPVIASLGHEVRSVPPLREAFR